MTNGTASQPSIDIGRYWAVIASRWPVILGSMAVGLLVAVSYLLLIPRMYTATTTLAIFPISSDPYAANRNSSNLLDMTAEASMASSFKVAQAAANSTGGAWAAPELRTNTTVSAGSGSTVMTVSVDANSEALARQGASAMAEAYLQTRSQQAAESIDNVVRRDRERIDKDRQQLRDAIKRLAASKPGSPAAAEATADQQILNLQISALLSRISALEGIDTTGGVILNPASMTTISVTPSVRMALAVGAAAGLGIGVLIAFISHARRRTVSTERGLARELDIEALGTWTGDQLVAATIAQQLLRMATLNNARVIAFAQDPLLESVPSIAASVGEQMRLSGTPAAIASLDEGDISAEGDGVALLQVATQADQAARLHALRVSNIVVLVAQAGKTKIKDLMTLVDEADRMGSRVVGTILLPKPGVSKEPVATAK